MQDLKALTQVVEAYEAVNREFDITQLRWCVHHVPAVTPELLTRLRRSAAACRWPRSAG